MQRLHDATAATGGAERCDQLTAFIYDLTRSLFNKRHTLICTSVLLQLHIKPGQRYPHVEFIHPFLTFPGSPRTVRPSCRLEPSSVFGSLGRRLEGWTAHSSQESCGRPLSVISSFHPYFFILPRYHSVRPII